MSKRTIIVAHADYGCDTGCCGHVIEVDGEEVPDSFTFDHPSGDDFRKWAEGLVREACGEDHVKDLDWDNSIVLED